MCSVPQPKALLCELIVTCAPATQRAVFTGYTGYGIIWIPLEMSSPWKGYLTRLPPGLVFCLTVQSEIDDLRLQRQGPDFPPGQYWWCQKKIK